MKPGYGVHIFDWEVRTESDSCTVVDHRTERVKVLDALWTQTIFGVPHVAHPTVRNQLELSFNVNSVWVPYACVGWILAITKSGDSRFSSATFTGKMNSDNGGQTEGRRGEQTVESNDELQHSEPV